MTAVTGLYPYDIDNLLDGPARPLFAPITQAFPDDISDIVAMVDPYAPKTGWVDFGATAGPAVTARNMTSASYNIQQTTNAVRSSRSNQTRLGVMCKIGKNFPRILAVVGQFAVKIRPQLAGIGTCPNRPRSKTLNELLGQPSCVTQHSIFTFHQMNVLRIRRITKPCWSLYSFAEHLQRIRRMRR